MEGNMSQQNSSQDGSDAVEDAIEEVPYEPSAERKVLIQPYDYAVRTLMDMVIEGDLVLDPDYQRNYRWPDEKASRFIESIALNIPVPVFYLAEEPDGRFSVIDGQQRLTSLFRFIKPKELGELFSDRNIPELVLSGLKVRADLNGKRYVDLSNLDRSLLAKRPMRCIVVLNESDDTLKFEVFERLNSGSASLTDQEVRNCLYRGSFNELLKELANYQKFQDLISLPEQEQKSMKDVELVLRFFAYAEMDDERKYSGSYTEFLNHYMEENREISASRREAMRRTFIDTVDLLFGTLGPGVAFRKPLNIKDPTSSKFATNKINGSIYESQMIAVSRLMQSGRVVPPDLKDRILSVFANENYVAAILQGTARRAKVLSRTRILDHALNA